MLCLQYFHRKRVLVLLRRKAEEINLDNLQDFTLAETRLIFKIFHVRDLDL